MKKSILTITTLTIVAISSSAFIVKYSSGIPGRTGSPGEQTCASCHNPNTAIANTSISTTPAIIGNQYVPGQTYTINVQVSSPTLNNFGFGCEILNGTSNAASNSGVITAIPGSSKILNSAGRTNATHTGGAAIGVGNTKTFNFLWVAPASGLSVIYAAGLATNVDGTENTGDATATASLSIGGTVGIFAIEKNAVSLNVFPNPSNDNLTLEYSLINDGNVKAGLFNLQGKEICVLFNANQSAGKHSKTVIYPNTISEGIYMLKLSSNGKELVEKMIIKR